MTGRVTVIFTLLTLVAAFVPAIAQEKADEEALRRQLMDAETKATELTTRLETLYLSVQTDFELFRSERWRQVTGPLEVAIDERMDALRSDPETAGPALAGDFTAAKLVNDEVARRLALAAAARAGQLARGESMSATDLLKHAAAAVFPKQTFADCWDAGFTDLPLVTEWKAANEAVVKAKAVLAAAVRTEEEPKTPPGMVLIPAGRYTWGPWTGWEDGLKKNKAAKKKVDAFYIDVTEVTNGQYRKFLEAADAKLRKGYLAHGFALNDDGAVVIVAKGWDARMPARGMTHPAATACAKFLGKRLPTEIEWEVAARGKETRVYPWGDDFGKRVANTKEAGNGGPVRVGTMKGDRSPLGLLDMGGNVSEMTSTLKDRDRVKGPLGPEHSFIHRGGNYDEDEESARVSYRFPIMAVEKSEPTVGFRCALSAKDWKQK